MKDRKLWEYNPAYTFFRPYIQWAFRTCYSKVSVIGSENIPDTAEVSVIIASNHCNTLMDALTILQSRKDPTAFVARADIFREQHIAQILHNLKILPIYRHRDGADSAERNVEIFDSLVECISRGTAFSIFPEGTHRARRSLLPLHKGVMEIARLAVESEPDRPVCIVPAGITYADFFNLMRPVVIRFGKPLTITKDTDPDEMKAVLAQRMSELFVCFPDDERLEENEKAYEDSITPRYGPLHLILAVFLLPVFVIAGLLCSPILAASAIIGRRLKDRAWINTVRFASKLALTPLMVAAAAITGFITMPWYRAAALTVLTLYAHPVFYRILTFYKILFKSCKQKTAKDEKPGSHPA